MREQAEKLYNSLTNISAEFIEEAQSAGEKAPHRIKVKWAALAACLCLVVALAVPKGQKAADAGSAGMSLDGDPNGYYVPGGQAPNGSEVSERDPAEEAQAAKEDLGAPDSSEISDRDPDEEAQAGQDASGALGVQQEDLGAPDVQQGENFFPSNIKTMISSYGSGEASACYKSPDNGSVIYSVPLKGAMEEYGDSVLYRVSVDVFSDNEQLKPNSETVKDERDRLAELGYTVSFEEYYDGAESHYYFTLHATCEQLENFPVSDSLGYMLWLYDERAR